MIYDLIIIGGGVSGVIAAISYKRKNPNKKILIIERNKELLRKLAVTGNGKCNFTNDFIDPNIYNNGIYFKNIINDKTRDNILDFFDYLNIKYYKDKEGRYYPLSNSAKAIRNILVSKLNNDEYILNTKIIKLNKINDVFIINSDKKEFKSLKLIIATGSKNYSSLGSDLNLYDEIIKLKHTFTNLYPSNIYVKVKEKDVTSYLSGLRFSSLISLYNNNELIYKEEGELLFKDDALSGIVVFNISSRLSNLYKEDKINNPYFIVDFLPKINKSLLTYLDNNENLKNNLYGLLNERLADLLIKKNKSNIIDLIKSFKFNIASLGDFEHAQVTCGGIKICEINNNLESKIIKNLYFLGDILDIDAPCGGYNLSFAINSGLKVGDLID